MRKNLTSLFPRALKGKFEKIRQVSDKATINTYYSSCPTDLATDGNNTLFIADAWHSSVFEINLKTENMIKVMGFSAQKANGPNSIALGADKVLWVYNAVEKSIIGLKKINEKWQQLEQTCQFNTKNSTCSLYAGTGLVCK